MDSISQISREDFKRAMRSLDETSLGLEDLARAFYKCGNAYVAERLNDACATIQHDSEIARKFVSSQDNEALKNAQQNSATILRAALAKAALSKDHNTEESESEQQ